MGTPEVQRTLVKPEELLRSVGIRAGWQVADFGCGPAYFVLPAARFVGTTGRVVGIDVRTAAVDEAKRRVDLAGLGEQVDIFRADLTRPRASGLLDGWADLVLCIGMLYQTDPRAVLQEAARVVKPSGGLVVVVEWEEVATPIGPPPERRLRRDDILAAAKSAGLQLLKTGAPSPHQYSLTFVRPGHE